MDKELHILFFTDTATVGLLQAYSLILELRWNHRVRVTDGA